MSNAQRISPWTLAAFASPAAPLLALSLPTIIFLPPHFVTHLGLGLEQVSLMFLSVRMLDLVIDPMIGGIQDRTKAPLGRRRFWMLLGAALLSAPVWFAFLGLGPGTNQWTAMVVIAALYTSFSALQIAHLSWAGELIPTYDGRTRVLGVVQAFAMLGQISMLALAAYVRQGLGGTDADAVQSMGWAILVSLPVTALLAVLFTKETHHVPHARVTLAETFRVLRENANLRRVILPDLLVGATQGLTGGLFLFYFQHVLGFEREAQTLLLVYFVAGLAGVPIWTFLGRRIGKHRTLQIGCLYWAVATAIIPFVPHGNFQIAAPLMALSGVAQSTGVLLLRAMMADVVDEDEVVTGARRSGLFFGILLTTTKLGLSMGPLALLPLGWAGFHAAAGAHNDAQALMVLSVLFVGAPIVLLILAAWTLNRYKLDAERQAELARMIAARGG